MWPDAKLPVMLAWGFKDVDTGGGAGVPGTVRVSSQNAVDAGWMLSAEGCGRLYHARVCTGVEGSSLRRCTWTLKRMTRRSVRTKAGQMLQTPKTQKYPNVPADCRQPHTHRGAQTKPQRRLIQATLGHASLLASCFTSSFEFSHATANTLTVYIDKAKHTCGLFFFPLLSQHPVLQSPILLGY